MCKADVSAAAFTAIEYTLFACMRFGFCYCEAVIFIIDSLLFHIAFRKQNIDTFGD